MDIIDENGDLLDFYVFLYSWKISWFSLEDWWHALQIIEELDKSEETVVNILEGSKRPRESAQTKEFKAEREAQKKIFIERVEHPNATDDDIDVEWIGSWGKSVQFQPRQDGRK